MDRIVKSLPTAFVLASASIPVSGSPVVAVGEYAHKDAAASKSGHPAMSPKATTSDAPNVFLFMSDDVGFAVASTFGAPVPTPNLGRLAKGGVRYNRFHTTGICSPSRAALLTGRNHHHVGFGYLADLPADHAGYHAEIPKETAGLGETLDVGRDTGVPVTTYGVVDGAYLGDIHHVRISVSPDREKSDY